MRQTTHLLLIAALLAAATGAAAAEPEKATTKPALKDICKDCVDPYNTVLERARFFTAAGVDSELDPKEFAKDKARSNGFVRVFDTWEALLAFDKDANKVIDWFEADAYRRDVRKRVLSVYDTSGDGRLKGAERDAANKALAEGKVPAKLTSTTKEPVVILGGSEDKPAQSPATGTSPYSPWRWSEQARLRMFDKDRNGTLDAAEKAAITRWEADYTKRREESARQAARYRAVYAEMIKKHDSNGNGRIDADEREAFYADYRERARIIRWDTDGDGQLSAAEKQEMETKQAEWKKRAEENRRKWMLQRWDKDKDGQMSTEETAAMEAHQAEMKKRAEQYRKEQAELREQHDENGDGQLDAMERQAYHDTLRHRAKLRRWDANKDGELDETETKAMADEQARWRKRNEEYRRQWELRRWDKNKDGQLDEAERKAKADEQAAWRRRNEEYRRQWELRRWDKNKDGQLDEAERKTMEDERARWRRGVNVRVNGQPIQAGQGGVRVWPGPGQTTGPIIIRRRGQEQ